LDLIPATLAEVEAARERLRGIALRTPLVPLAGGGFIGSATSTGPPPRILLKLENLQPIGSFKIRGAVNAMTLAGSAAISKGVYTASAGNMAQGVAWAAREMGVPCKVIAPETAPQTKIAAIERLGGEVIRVTFDTWWQTMQDRRYPGIEGLFVHPFADQAVMAGNGTIGLEILDDAPDVDAILVPYGGGGLSSGIAAAVRARAPGVRVYAAEVANSAPLTASFAQDGPAAIDPLPSFIDGIGGKGVFPEMWPVVRELLAGSVAATVAEVAEAVRLLAERNRIVAEGAGATPVAAALHRPPDARTIVCVVSGGNIDTAALETILRGEVPSMAH
jgi:threonine dehydratase